MRRFLVAAVVTAIGAAMLSGCPAAHSDYPSAACKVDSDCYVGEQCMDNSICVPIGADLSVVSTPKHDLGHGGDDR
jgi:hypothetical protein